MQFTDYFHRILLPRIIIVLLHVPILGNLVMQLTMLLDIELKEINVERIVIIQLASIIISIIIIIISYFITN